MRVSVILPVLNEARVIGERLRELEDIHVAEVIVADGGSNDRTQEIVTSHPWVHWICAPRGRALQMNAGATKATGDVLLFLHADVSLPHDALTHIERALASDRVVGGAFRTWTVADRPTRLGPLLHLADLRSRYSSLPYGDQAQFVRREVFQRVGGFPELALMEDLAMSQRLRAEGELCTVPACVRVSGRRFIERPFFYTALVNVYPTLYRLGVPASVLARFYRAVR